LDRYKAKLKQQQQEQEQQVSDESTETSSSDVRPASPETDDEPPAVETKEM